MKESIRKICRAGSGNHRFFGGTWTGGYLVQQNPRELAELIRLLQEHQPYEHSLEIGVAAGGTTRLIRQTVEIGSTAVIDNAAHPQYGVWRRNKQEIEPLDDFAGDSHSPAAAEFLAGLNRKFNYVAIDGDHSYDGVCQDWDLVQPYLAERAIVWFHDIHVLLRGNDGANRLWHERLSIDHEVLLETPGPFGIGVIRV